MTFFCSTGIKERRSKADFAPTWKACALSRRRLSSLHPNPTANSAKRITGKYDKIKAINFGGKECVQENRQGCLARSITRRSGSFAVSETCTKQNATTYVVAFCLESVNTFEVEAFRSAPKTESKPSAAGSIRKGGAAE